MNVNDHLPVFPGEHGAQGPLLDHVQSTRIKENPADDVRAAFHAAKDRGNRERIASEIGRDGAAAIRRWDDLAETVGPQQAALQAAELYRQQPRTTRPEPALDEKDPYYETRLAVRKVREQERVRSELPQTLEHLDAIEARHGSLDVVERRKALHEQFVADPVSTAPRATAEFAAEMHQRQTLPRYEAIAAQFIEQHNIKDPEQFDRMVEYLGAVSSGDRQADLRMSKDYAEYTMALDRADP
jgi:hypothetical protein